MDVKFDSDSLGRTSVLGILLPPNDDEETVDSTDANEPQRDENASSTSMDTSQHVRQGSNARVACSACGRLYSRIADLRYHVQRVHAHGDPGEPSPCPICAKPFRTRKDMLVHVRMKRCHSKRGRNHAAITTDTAVESSSNDGQCRASDLESTRFDVSVLNQETND